MAQIDRSFVRIREGQVHVRRAGPPAAGGAPKPLWMVHASPASSVSLTGLMAALAPGRPVIAPDTLGNGDSAPPEPAAPDIAYYADSSLRVMDALGIDKADLYGSHTGAHIVAEMAIARPDRFGRVILDGIAMFSPEEKRDVLANYAPAVQPDFFGGHFHWAWNFVRDQAWYFPYFRRDVAHLRLTDPPSADVLHRTAVEVLKSIRTYHLAYRAAFAHADRERLPLVRLPTLVMADDTDPLRAGVDVAASVLPGALKTILQDSAAPDALARKAALYERFLDQGTL